MALFKIEVQLSLKAGSGNRTRLFGLENRHNNRYTIPALKEQSNYIRNYISINRFQKLSTLKQINVKYLDV